MTAADEGSVPRNVEYSSDPDIEIGGLPEMVGAIWVEYESRNSRETRTLPEAIERVHFGECWLRAGRLQRCPRPRPRLPARHLPRPDVGS